MKNIKRTITITAITITGSLLLILCIHILIVFLNLNPDKVNLKDGTWIEMFSFDVKERGNKRNFVTVYYRKPKNHDRIDTLPQGSGERTYEIVIVRDKIVPFGRKVISSIIPQQFSIGLPQKNNMENHAFAQFSTGILHPSRKRSVYAKNDPILEVFVKWNRLDNCTARISHFYARNVGTFGGEVSSDIFFQRTLFQHIWPITMDCKQFFEGVYDE